MLITVTYYHTKTGKARLRSKGYGHTIIENRKVGEDFYLQCDRLANRHFRKLGVEVGARVFCHAQTPTSLIYVIESSIPSFYVKEE